MDSAARDDEDGERGHGVELTGAAVEALRALPREERTVVARRLDQLAETGLPPGMRGRTSPVELGAGDQILVCVEDPEDGRVVVVSIRPANAGLGTMLARLLRRTLPRWIAAGRGGEMGTIRQDLRYAVRSLARSPGFAITAVVTLALGIGATAAIFSVASGVLLAPLPYGDADRLVTVWSSWNNFPDKTWVSFDEYRYYHANASTFEDLALYQRGSASFTAVDRPERVGVAAVTPNTFAVLGVQPIVGRGFTAAEATDSVAPVVLAHSAWQRRYDGDPGIVGRDVEIDGALHPVVGVLPEGFALPIDYGLPDATEVFVPLFVDLDPAQPHSQNGGSHGSFVVARLRPGETASTALADLENIVDRLRADGTYPAEMDFHPRVYAAKADIVGSAGTTILVLLGAVGFVLLIACGNVANLQLSRSEARLREVAVRVALGAGRGRIVRQLLTESAVIAGVSGALGLVIAFAGVETLLAIDPTAVPRADAIGIDVPVVLATLGVSALTALLFGIAPALRVSSRGLSSRLHEGGRSGARASTAGRLQGALVAAQMAMAVVLLTGSGLMIRTFVGLTRIDPGFRAERVLTLEVAASQGRYPDAASVALFYEELLRRVEELPGVRSVGAVRRLPLASEMGDSGFRPVDYQPQPNESTQADWQWATPGYIETMGIPLVEGRTFDARDGRDAPAVVLVNRTVARRYWGERSPLGSRVVGGGGDTATVVGVVGDLHHNGITSEVKTRFYRPHAQIAEAWSGTMRGMTLTIGAEGDPLHLVEPVRAVVLSLDPSMPIAAVQTIDDVLEDSLAQPRFATTLLGAFAAIAMTLAVIGIYGVLAYAVSQRKREIGIRLALGAEGGRVVAMVVGQGMLMASVGVVVGTATAWFLTGTMEGLLYGVEAQDPATFLTVPALFAGVALLASWVPAARAARVRPAATLREE